MILLYPVIYCVFLSILVGPIGSIILWRRLSFFGETIAHASLLGGVIQYFFHIPFEASLILLSFVYCVLLEVMQDKKLDHDSLLPMLSYGFLGISLFLIQKFIKQSSLLFSLMLGDILLISPSDCWFLGSVCILVLLIWKLFSKPLLLMLVSDELAKLQYPSVRWIGFLMNFMSALGVVFTVQGVGVLLAMAMLTISPLTAAYLAKSPNQMMITASLLSFASCIIGMVLGFSFNVALGPCITITSLAFYILCRLSCFFYEAMSYKFR